LNSLRAEHGYDLRDIVGDTKSVKDKGSHEIQL